MQLELTDPSWAYGEPYQTVIANVGDAVVDGVDLDVTFLPSENWTLGLVSTYLFKAEIDKNISVFDDRDPDDLALDIPAGTQLPLSSDLNVAAFAEYSWPVNWLQGAEAYLRVQYSYTGTSYNAIVDNDGDPNGDGYGGRVEQPEYQLWDLRAGLTNDIWEFTVYLDNVADERVVNYHDMNADVFWGRDNIRTSLPRRFGMSLRRYFK